MATDNSDSSTVPPRTDRTQTEIFKKNSGDTVSLCISRVFPNISWRRIKRHMIETGLGKGEDGGIERIDVVPVFKEDEMTGEKRLAFKRAFIHFRKDAWNDTPVALEALEKLRAGETLKIVYEEPWWWLVSVSMSPRPTEAPRPRRRYNPEGSSASTSTAKVQLE